MSVRVDTTRFGVVEVPEEMIITMPSGMLGFADFKRYVLIRKEEIAPFLWYQAVEAPSLAFVITAPHVVTTDYSPDTAALIKDLNWNGADRDVEVYVVVNLGSGTPEEMTVNLMGPVLINPHRREAAQVVLHDSPFSCRHPVFP